MTKNIALENFIYIIVALGIVWLIQSLYYLLVMARAPWKKSDVANTSQPPVSVIICAKNEQENLRQNLPLILSQQYPDFQVVVVNDCSEDDTEMVLAQFKKEYANLYYTNIPIDKKFFHGKKLALVVGVKAAKHDLLLLTDADCRPESEQWLAGMTSALATGREMVLGYGKYTKEKGFLNTFVRYETLWNAIQYMGHALAHKPFMAVGRNLAYTKSLFNSSSQFRNNLTTASGDDDLFVMEMGTRHNTTVCFIPQAQTISNPVATFNQWFERKARHLATAPKYPWATQLLLGTELISRLFFYLLSIYCLIFNIFIPIVIALLVTRLALIHIIILRAAKRYNEKGMLFAVLLMDILTPCFQAVAWTYKLFGRKKSRWR